MKPERAKEEDVLLVHTKMHYEYVKSDEDVFEVAMLAVGGAILASEISFKEPAFALIRPPGHHASPDSSWGFCYFNNIAIAVKNFWLERELKNAIVDFDLHYGDGTANVFRWDPKVKYHHMSGANIEELLNSLKKANTT